MRPGRFQKWIVSAGLISTILTAGLGGCASPPHERPDREKIKQDADKSMQDLKREENRNRDDY